MEMLPLRLHWDTTPWMTLETSGKASLVESFLVPPLVCV